MNWVFGISAAFILILTAWLAASAANNVPVQHLAVPRVPGNFSETAACNGTQTGWFCTFPFNGFPFNGSERRSPLLTAYEKECEAEGGKWTCYGFCFPYYEHYCDVPYADAGEPCIASIQCGGTCVSSGTFMGNCSAYPMRECDNYVEIVFGIPAQRRYVVCD